MTNGRRSGYNKWAYTTTRVAPRCDRTTGPITVAACWPGAKLTTHEEGDIVNGDILNAADGTAHTDFLGLMPKSWSVDGVKVDVVSARVFAYSRIVRYQNKNHRDRGEWYGQ